MSPKKKRLRLRTGLLSFTLLLNTKPLRIRSYLDICHLRSDHFSLFQDAVSVRNACCFLTLTASQLNLHLHEGFFPRRADRFPLQE